MTRLSGILRNGAALALAAAALAACATPMPTRMAGSVPQSSPRPTAPGGKVPATMRPYQIKGQWYYPAEQPNYDQVGVGSWYGEQFHNRFTSNGEVFDMDAISAAHKTLPLPSLVEVTNLDNGRKITLRVNDRGPFVDSRIIDLSRAAADQLGYRKQGVARVRVRYLGPAPKSPLDGQRIAQLSPTPVAPAVVAPTPTAPIPWAPPPLPPRAATAPEPAPRFALAEPPGYRVQAAAFANRDNAEKAVALLGQAVIEPGERDGLAIYRVILGPAPDEPAAWALRDQAAARGFADARVLQP